jgi:hypothetical protein
MRLIPFMLMHDIIIRIFIQSMIYWKRKSLIMDSSSIWGVYLYAAIFLFPLELFSQSTMGMNAMTYQQYAWQNIALDGTLSFKIPVGSLKVDQNEEIPLFVTHHLAYDPVTKQAQSQFRIEFLETWLIPKTNETFLWRQPSGRLMTVFANPANPETTVQAKRIEESQIELIRPDNWRFYYTKGQLTFIHLPNKKIWKVLSQAGRISRILEKNVDGDITVLQGNYFPEKRGLSHLKTQTHEVSFTYEKDLVRSITIKPGNEAKKTYLLSYQEGLITQIKTPEKTIPISWKKIEEKHFSVLESASLKPIRVSMIEGRRINFSYSSRGIITEISSPTDNQTIRRMVNPKTRSITEYGSDGEETIISRGKAYR